MKIVNLKRFVLSMLILVILICVFILLFNINSYSNTEIKYMNFKISEKDTLWNIACMIKNNNLNYKNKDTREIIYEIKQINNMKTSDIYINDVIIIPEI